MFRQLFVLVALAAIAIASPVPEDQPERGGRIVGGFNAGTNQFPYQVSLRTNANL